MGPRHPSTTSFSQISSFFSFSFLFPIVSNKASPRVENISDDGNEKDDDYFCLKNVLERLRTSFMFGTDLGADLDSGGGATLALRPACAFESRAVLAFEGVATLVLHMICFA